MAFEHFDNLKPEDLNPKVEGQPTTTVSEPPKVEEPVKAEASTTPTEPPKSEPPKVEEPKTDEFIENFNKRYNTTYRSDDEVKGLFELPKKVTEYEEKVKDRDELAKSVEQYKKELDEYKERGVSDLLSRPLIQRAYVADQLLAKYPDRDAFVLQEIAMSDIDKMSDIEAIAKEKMISVKGLTLDEAKLAKLADFGIDTATAPEEWDSVAKARVKIAGAEAKERIKELLKGIQLPKIATKEEREALAAKALEDKVKASTPIKETFKKFEKYVNGDFEFAATDEFRAKLDDVFTGMFIDSGLEVNETNLKNAEFFKRAMFVEEYFPKMREVIIKQAKAEAKEEFEKLVHNETPLNTATATDQGIQTEESGVSNFLRNPRDERAKKI